MGLRIVVAVAEFDTVVVVAREIVGVDNAGCIGVGMVDIEMVRAGIEAEMVDTAIAAAVVVVVHATGRLEVVANKYLRW